MLFNDPKRFFSLLLLNLACGLDRVGDCLHDFQLSISDKLHSWSIDLKLEEEKENENGFCK